MKNYFLIQLAGILLLLISAAEINANQNLPDMQNSISEKIGDKTLVVLNLENGYSPHWFILSESGRVKLKNPPATMYQVEKLKSSADKKFLAVLSVGEGHPEIGIFKLEEVLADKDAKVVFGIDPYPGIVDLVEWQGDVLHIISTIFLTEKSEEYGRVPDALSLFSPESFLLDIRTGNIEPLEDKLKNPTSYYGNHLLEHPDENSPLTELWALSELNDTAAIPYLRKALEMNRYVKSKKEIHQLLIKLKSPKPSGN